MRLAAVLELNYKGKELARQYLVRSTLFRDLLYPCQNLQPVLLLQMLHILFFLGFGEWGGSGI